MDRFLCNGDDRMKRAMFVALGTGLVITSAAALDIAGAREAPIAAEGQVEAIHTARVRESARSEQRARIDARYMSEREACATKGGFQRDKCLVKAHANRGRAMLAAAAPYEARQ